MAEAVGLALAGAGLLSLFSTCLDVLDIIDTASSYGRDVSLLNQMFDNQRYQLVMWANACFRSPASFDRRLLDALPRAQIQNNLNCVHLLLEDESRLQKQFGLNKARQINTAAVTTPQNAVFQHAFVVFRNRIRQTQQTASLKEIVRWSIRDRKKFLELINFLKTYIDGLWDVAKSLGLGYLQRQEAEATMHTLPDEVSQSVAAPAVISGDPLSDAALARNLRRLSLADQTRPQLQLPAMSYGSSLESKRQEGQAVAVLFVDYGNSCQSVLDFICGRPD
jgi:Prion-inhibition and propagation